VAKTHQKVFGSFDPAPTVGGGSAADTFAVEKHAQKLQLVAELLEGHPDEQAVLFVQDAAAFRGIERVFGERGISHAIIKTDAEADKLEGFKAATPAQMQVLVLEITKEYAAGTNLFNANHVVFLSPFFSTSGDDYAEKKLQAIRRVYRQGQEKPVTVHNFVGVSKTPVPYSLANPVPGGRRHDRCRRVRAEGGVRPGEAGGGGGAAAGRGVQLRVEPAIGPAPRRRV
jgi:hypothetical protein